MRADPCKTPLSTSRCLFGACCAISDFDLVRIGKVSFEDRVRELTEGNKLIQLSIEPMLRARAALRSELVRLERMARDITREDPVCRLMMTMPGIGPVVALTVRSTIDDPGRFRRSKDVGPSIGLTPRRYQSGGRISSAVSPSWRPRHEDRALSSCHCGDPPLQEADLVARLGGAGRSSAWGETGGGRSGT